MLFIYFSSGECVVDKSISQFTEVLDSPRFEKAGLGVGGRSGGKLLKAICLGPVFGGES